MACELRFWGPGSPRHHTPLTAPETLIAIFFFAATALVGLRFSWKGTLDTQGYFLAGRDLAWPMVGLSLLGADSFAVLLLRPGILSDAWTLSLEAELLGIFLLLFAGPALLQRYASANISTAPEFLERHFDRPTRLLVSTGSLFIAIAVRIALTVVLGTLLLAQTTTSEVPGLVTSAVMVAGLLALAGGFLPVAAVQSLCGIAALLALLGIPLTALSADPVMDAAAALPGSPAAGGQSLVGSGMISWLGTFVGLPMLVFWYWGADQYMVQHLLAARDRRHAGRGMRLAAIIKTVVLAGGALLLLLPPAGSGHPLLQTNPAGRGLAMVAILAAMTSSLAGAFSSASSLATLDLYGAFVPDASQKQIVLAGRLGTIGALVMAILFIPLSRILGGPGMHWFFNSLVLLASPIAAVFLLGLFWKTATARMARWMITVTGLIAFSRVTLEAVFDPGEAVNPVVRAFLEVPCFDGSAYLLGVAALIALAGGLVTFLRPARA